MLKLRGRHAILSMGAVLTLGLSSCGVSTVQQCNDLAEVMNQSEEFESEFEAEMEAFGSQFANSADIESIKTMAGSYMDVVGRVVVKIEEMTTNLQAVNLPDETLAGYRDQYAEVTTKFGQELAKTSEAMASLKDVETEADLIPAATAFQEKAVDAFTNLDSLSTEGDQLTSQIKEFCEAEAG
ncbi:hypothetical protein Lepto7376_2144 [[Leptolyngbya] sp. PCC 7376]|uniref:hypothetical protein n=1 Tax=[Leptolyngbya] sp. PCC 7376 TaxID=111781 RepID=UPI00029EE153|nr:hypothetical protein [[Leptolyngbya] sp. PCC 7376]AFY38439.1 hypothetical protein Lepto7376_2144 [[Leptolyngbya] sp. PCC 7376]